MMGEKKFSPPTLFFYFLPSLFLVFTVLIYPIFFMIDLSLKEHVFRDVYEYVGLKNFITLFTSKLFWHSCWVTLEYTLGSVGLAFTWGLILALLVNEKVKGQILFRTILVLPWILPGVATAINFRWVFNEDIGLINYFLSLLGVGPIPWFTDQTWAMILAIFVNSWKIAPFGMVMILGALQSIPRHLYEAAEVDGASAFTKFLYITVPGCRGAITTVLLMEIIWSTCSFTLLYLLTNGGGPLDATLILPLYIYRTAFEQLNFELAAAASVTLLIILSFFTITYLKYIKGGEGGFGR
jgi:ABC-type sugar transport system permease subunit